MNMDSWISQLTRERELHWPPAPFTPDWEAAHRSIEALADLEPSVVAAGHGLPITGRSMAEELRDFADRFTPPHTGRYVDRPVRADEGGVREVPPPVADPFPKRFAAGAAIAAAVLGIALVRRRGRRRR